MTANSSDLIHTIAEKFSTGLTVESVAPLGNGLVNDTYLLTLSETAPRVLQKINGVVFPQPQAVIANMQKVLDHLRKKITGGVDVLAIRQVPRLYPAADNRYYIVDDDGNYWRLMEYLQQTRCFDTLQSDSMALALGQGLGEFHALLSDMQLEYLTDTLPGFHVTPAYYEQYMKVLAGSTIEGELSQYCVDFIAAREHRMTELENMKSEIPLRVMHGDPKLNNFLFSQGDAKVQSLIDLDTVKPGLIQYDIGDCIRSACNPAGENPRLRDSIDFHLPHCKQILAGYFSRAGKMLVDADKEAIVTAIVLLPLELGMRFFTDYLQGNIYFKVTNESENLDRAVTQFRLLESIERQFDAISDIVATLD